MKLILLTTFFVSGLIFFFPAILSAGISYLPERIQPEMEATQRIFGAATLNQEFLSKKSNLAGIGLSIKNPYFRNKKDLLFSIKNDKGKTIRSVVHSGKNINDGNFLIIKFDPIIDSKDKNFSFELFSPDSADDDSLEVFISKNPESQGSNFKVNNEYSDWSLAYVTYYKQRNPILNWVEIYKNALLRFSQDTGFFMLYVFLITLALSILMRGYFKVKSE